MSTGAKLQLRPGSRVAILGMPPDVRLDLPEGCSSTTEPAEAGAADAVIVFVAASVGLERLAGPAITAAREDRLAWLAYPKSGQLGTDINRDILARLVLHTGVQPVRQVAIDSVWSALRFRPAS